VLVIDTFSADVPNAATLKVTLTEFNNPIEINPDVGLQITTFDNFMTKVDQSSKIKLQVTMPSSIVGATVAIDSGSAIINQNSGLKFDFNVPIPLVTGCIFSVKVPDSHSKNLSTIMKTLYVYGMFGSLRIMPFTI
jgi:hypothetical protein